MCCETELHLDRGSNDGGTTAGNAAHVVAMPCFDRLTLGANITIGSFPSVAGLLMVGCPVGCPKIAE